jgi:hypothetical protein
MPRLVMDHAPAEIDALLEHRRRCSARWRVVAV